MHTTTAGRRRRTHSAEFKAEAVAACRVPGVSIASVALARSLNANLLRKWVHEGERPEAVARKVPKALPAPLEPQRFVPVTVSAPPKTAESRVRVEIRRGALFVTVEWPASAARECAQWLRKLLK